MKSSLTQLDYRFYRLARLLGEHLDLGELVAISAGPLEEELPADEEEA